MIDQSNETANGRGEQRLPALAVSRGIGIGRIVVLDREKPHLFRYDLAHHGIDAEMGRFRSALDTAIQELHQLAEERGINSHESLSDIFGVHLLILQSSFSKKIESAIKSQRVNAEWAIRTISDQYRERQSVVSDRELREKALDIDDVADRLIKALDISPNPPSSRANAVVFARELSPSTIVELAKNRAVGFIAEQGGWTSHASIVARDLNIPMVCGVRNLDEYVLSDQRVIVDGNNGEVIIAPSDKTIAEFASINIQARHQANNGSKIGEGNVTVDGVSFIIRANIDQALSYLGNDLARGVGLFRSESLIGTGGEVPTEDLQVETYVQMADMAAGHPVRIRTFDVDLNRLGIAARERNPALGLRAIRLSLADPTHFCVQIRAILRAASGRKIDIILPMISGIDEVLRAKAIIADERQRSIMAGCEVGEPQIGAMIETPSAILTAFEIAQNVDFLCLGTNDLVQYLLAVDRDNDAVADWYQTLHPAVIRAITEVLSAAERANTPVAVCGEMAGSPFYAPVLLGLGAREFSINSKSASSIGRLLSLISVRDATDLVANIRTLKTAAEIEEYLRKYYSENWPSLFRAELIDIPSQKIKN